MNWQRRNPSCGTQEAKERFKDKFTAVIRDQTIEESHAIKTLGVSFDSELTFKKYWGDVKSSVWKRIYGLGQVKCHIPFLHRKDLGQGLVISKLSYCIEATSCCPQNVLQIGKKLLNRTVREVCGEYRWEKTKACYHAVGWLDLQELSIFRTYILAQKLLKSGGPQRLLARIADKVGDLWTVKEDSGNYRTALGKRSFLSRVIRIWSLL